MHKLRLYLVFFYVLFRSGGLFSQVVYSTPSENIEIGNYAYFLEDKENNMTIDQVAKNAAFKRITAKVQNFGITASAIWLRITIQNKTNIGNLILQVNQPIIDEIEFYAYDNKTAAYSVVKMGEYQSFGLRKYLTPQYLFDLRLQSDSIKTYFLKVRSKENLQVPISLGTRISVLNYFVVSNLASGIYIGIMVVMLLYNLFIFGTLRDKSYVLYSFYILFTLITQTGLQGYTFQFLWPDHPSWAVYNQFIFPSLTGVLGLEFLKQFLRVKERANRAYKFSFVFVAIYAFSIILSLLGYFDVSFKIVEGVSGATSIFMLSVAVIIYRQGNSEARFFLVGWSVFLLGVCIYVMKDFGALPYNNFTRYTMHFGSAFEVILLSFALADRINIFKREKEQSQAEALLISQQNQKLVAEQNIILEQKVYERTLELEETNEELNVTLSYLKDTQAQLVDAEKMASLGQLTAGIAHEINNPINFVSANLKPLKLDINDILELIKKYEAITPGDGIEEKLKEVEAFKKRIDIEYLKTEIQELLAGIDDGAKRTAEIVSGLKNFSRLDESEIKQANINEGIESTLVLLRSSIPETINVVSDLGNVPFIECYPGKLNQVFMNLLSNAVYAMKKKTGAEQNTLTITSYMRGEKVCVSVEDTGIGMSQQVKEKIFEPFFTTKDVGEGTGLGMSIVFKIVESHHAKLEIQSEQGVGTKITLVLNKRIS